MKIRIYLAAIISSLILSSCANFQQKKQYQAPELDYLTENTTNANIKDFFNGEVEAFAITQDKNGKINGSYTAEINGKWNDNRGTIEQSFVKNDGSKEYRTWLITLEDEGKFTAIGHDVASPGKGKQIGNAVQMLYTLSLEGHDAEGFSTGKEDVKFEDTIYAVDENSMIMISNMIKGNNYVGKTIVSLKKLSNDKKPSAKKSKSEKEESKEDSKEK